MIYALDTDRRQELVARSLKTLANIDGVDLTMHLADGEGVIPRRLRRAALRPGRRAARPRGER